jgi:hypothetical protein
MIAVGKEQAERGGEIAPKIVRDCETWIVKEGGDPPLFFQSEAEAQHYANWKASGLPWAEYVAYNSREEAKRREQKRADDLRAKWLKYNEDEARRLQEAACRSVSRLREMISEEEIAALKARIAEVQARWSELTYEQLEHGRDQIWDYEYYLARRLGILTSEPAYGFIKYSSEEAI